MSKHRAKLFRWSEIPKEIVTDQIERQVIPGDLLMLASVHLRKGCIVPKHSHRNEQFSYIVKGAMRFWIGEDEVSELVVRAGEVLHIPSNVPHEAEALADTLDMGIFTPPRHDWLSGDDAYFQAEPVYGGTESVDPGATPDVSRNE